MDFDHIEQEWLRNLLENGWDGDEDTICQALTYTENCLAEDDLNEHIPAGLMTSRTEFFEEASDSWNLEGDGFGAVDALRKAWDI
jgi:hypothetical protein